MTSVSLVKNIKTTDVGGSHNSYPDWLTVFDDKVFFTASDDNLQNELWSTDGTEAGTILISDIAGLFSGNPRELTADRYALTYSAFTTANGRELWYTTQSPHFTDSYGDLVPGSSSSEPKNITNWYHAPIFSAKDSDGLRYLWRSDINIEKVSPNHILPRESLITEFKGDIYFIANYLDEGDALWKYDGESFTEIFDYFPDTSENTAFREIKQSGNLLYFTASSFTQDGLFSTDGTPENTVQINSNESNGLSFRGADNLIDVNGTLYFAASTNNVKDIWRVDDNLMEALIVDPSNKERGINRADHLTLVNNKIFFEGTYSFDSELWQYDIIENTTNIVADINLTGDSMTRIDNTLTPYNDQLLFTARDEEHGEELWITDGQESGTYRITDLMEGSADSDIDQITVLGDKVIFRSDSDDYGIELFVWEDDLGSNDSSPVESEPNPQPEPVPEPYDGIIKSVSGKGKLRGTDFADAFTFESLDVFTKKGADKIIGFNSSQGDSINISPEAFPALKSSSVISFASTNKKKELKLLSKQDYDFVYFEKKGRLYFDGNGSKKNWGNTTDEGGLVAVLKGKPELTLDDFTFLA